MIQVIPSWLILLLLNGGTPRTGYRWEQCCVMPVNAGPASPLEEGAG